MMSAKWLCVFVFRPWFLHTHFPILVTGKTTRSHTRLHMSSFCPVDCSPHPIDHWKRGAVLRCGNNLIFYEFPISLTAGGRANTYLRSTSISSFLLLWFAHYVNQTNINTNNIYKYMHICISMLWKSGTSYELRWDRWTGIKQREEKRPKDWIPGWQSCGQDLTAMFRENDLKRTFWRNV